MHPPPLSRRSLLGTLGTAAVAGLAGCSDDTGGSGTSGPDQQTYLEAKDWGVDPEALPFPTHGDELPSVSVPRGLADETRDVPADYTGTDVLMTFIYTNCMTMCPRLTSILEGVQDHAIENGYADRMTFAEMSFDPARDDAERFREWADSHGIDLETGTWEFLRPENEQRAKEIIQDKYGVTFVKTTPQGMDKYMFTHTGLVLLANKQGYVERTYKLSTGGQGGTVTWQDVETDLATLRDREQ